MPIKRAWYVFILAALLQAAPAAVPAGEAGGQGDSDILLRDLLWNMEWAQQSVRDMTFVFVTATAKGSSIEKLNEAAQQAGQESLPEETRMSIWIKKPDKMKIVAGDYKVIIRKEGPEWFSYQYAYLTGQTARQKLPRDTWPVWPSQERIVANLKKYMVKNTPYTILRDDAAAGGAAYVLTFKPKNTKEEYAYVIRIADWRILKSVFYEDGRASFAAEWRDIEANSALADKLFDFAESQAAPAAPSGATDTAAFPDADSPVEVLYAGVVKKEIIQEEGGYTIKNNSRYLRTRKFVDEKDTVPGTLGTAFGIIFTARGDDQLSLTARYLHPPMANALTREITTTHEMPLSVRPGEIQALSWVFTKEWEIAPGAWTLQLWSDGRKMAEKKFTVIKAADIYAHLGEWGRRLPAFNATLAKDPKDVKALTGLGNAYSEMGEYARALVEYTKAIEADPGSPTAYNGRCDVYTLQGEFDKALADCDKAIELKPKYTFAFINRGKAYDGKGDYEKAVADYTQAIELNPRYANAYFYRGLTLAQKDDIDGARADFEKVLELNPHDARARKKLEDL
ncbi:MAG: DUF3859 domain-containing protein [Candidatus Omnitrophica bacterium]|nr:DUF3859 domain-containing protein [Candidatus Omnitrophota bacterium]